MTCLLDLPHEVLHSILTHVEPHDLATISRSCQTLDFFVKDNRLLHKELYLLNWDHPCQNVLDHDFAWKDELQKVVMFKKMLNAKDQDLKKSNIEFLASTTVSLLKATPKGNAASQNLSLLHEMYQMPSNVRNLICGSSLFVTANGDSVPRSRNGSAYAEAAGQLSAKLHCLYGIPVQQTGKLEPTPIHPHARARVYDLRRYTRKTFWGPFRDDGSLDVDWERMEAIMIILDHNFQHFCDRTECALQPSWKMPFHGATPYSYVPTFHCTPNQDEPTEAELEDPYNITGTWMRIVCFLDYSELFAYNFAYEPPDINEDRQPLDTEEATRLIIMKLKVTYLEPPGEDDGQALPVAHFKGTSRALDSSWDPNANSDIRVIKGTVRLTKEGEVRWTTFSIYHGEERWRSEGIQIGGPSSARGVLGNWFDKDYDRHGPAGPTAFWKMHDGLAKEKRSTLHS